MLIPISGKNLKLDRVKGSTFYVKVFKMNASILVDLSLLILHAGLGRHVLADVNTDSVYCVFFLICQRWKCGWCRELMMVPTDCYQQPSCESQFPPIKNKSLLILSKSRYIKNQAGIINVYIYKVINLNTVQEYDITTILGSKCKITLKHVINVGNRKG